MLEPETPPMKGFSLSTIVSALAPERRLAPRPQPHLAIMAPTRSAPMLAFTVHLVAGLPVADELLQGSVLSKSPNRFGQENLATTGVHGGNPPQAMLAVCLPYQSAPPLSISALD